MRTLSKLSLIAAAALTTAAAVAAPTDVHPSGSPTNNTWIQGLSSDGLTAVGFSDIGGGSKAFKLVGTTLTQLDPLFGHPNSIAHAASTTGSLIVGT
jgi:uncharacterized membrane protein